MKSNRLYLSFITAAALGVSSSANAQVEGADVYLNNGMVFATLIVGLILFGIFLWGLVTFATVAPKIPELRENATDRDAKQKIVLKSIAGMFAMAAPVLAVALLITFFGDGLVQFFYSDGADTHSDAMGVLNQLNGGGTN